MKNLFKTTTAAGLALALLGAPLAMAQMAPQQHPGPQMAAHGNDTKPAPVQHMTQRPAAQHQVMQHPTDQLPPMHPAKGMSNHAPEQQHAQSGPSHAWHNGDRFNGNRQVVTDWSRYHARQPPAGYEWVQDGSQLVLISVASGVIADVIANAIYQ